MRDLDVDRIAAAGLAIADEFGASGFTVRALAKRLHVTPMALYRHVDDMAALATIVTDRAIRAFPFPIATGAWDDDLVALARWMRAVSLAHPGISELRRKYAVVAPATLLVNERWLGLWLQSGLAIDDATFASTSSMLAMAGLLSEESILRRESPPDPSHLNMLPNARLAYTAEIDYDRAFEFVVRSLVEALRTGVASGVGRRSAGPDELTQEVDGRSGASEARKPSSDVSR